MIPTETLEGVKKEVGVEKMEKEEVPGAAGEGVVKKGSSVEVKQEDAKEPEDVKPDTENLADVKLENNSKPTGEKYTPKVRPKSFYIVLFHEHYY